MKNSQQVISHLITQPALIPKNIKQELLDNTAKAIAERHNTLCKLSKYVQEHGDMTGLQIEDEHSLIDSDQEGQLSHACTSTIGHVAQVTSLPVTTTLLVPVVTMTTKPSKGVSFATQQPVNIVKRFQISSGLTRSDPLHLVMDVSTSKTSSPQPLHVVTNEGMLPTLTERDP